jgi:pimeloyl-ACP methyl ester carboxylesterase
MDDSQTRLIVEGCVVHRRGVGPPVIVCLPGFTDTMASWLSLIDPLSGGAEVAVLEFPGLGHPVAAATGGSLTQLAEAVVRLVSGCWSTPIVLLGHSLGSVLAVRAAHRLAGQCRAIVSIQGNLTADDAYFTGQAAGFDNPDTFKAALTAQARRLAAAGRVPASFSESVAAADPYTIWALGRDVATHGTGIHFGLELLQAPCRTTYLWSAATTPAASQDFIHAHDLPNRELGIGHHWPWLSHPTRIADLVRTFIQDGGRRRV